jgi:hypothetical protein
MLQCQPKSVVCGLQPHQTENRHARHLTSKRQLTSFAALLCHPWPFQTRWRSASTESSRSGSGRCQRQRAPLQRTFAIKRVRSVVHAHTHVRETVGVWVGGRVEGRSMECVTTWQHDSKMLDQNREASEASARFHKATRAHGAQAVAGQDMMQC